MSGAGHPIFPVRDMNEHTGPLGLTKREYFAAMAMIALHASEVRGGRWDETSAAICAKNAFVLADALLNELTSTEQGKAT